MMRISVRHAEFSELSRVVFITKFAYKIPYKKNTFVNKTHEPKDVKNKFLKKEFFIIVAVFDGKIIGAVRYKILKNNSLYFYKLAVLKTYRKIGAGLLLIKKVEIAAKKNGCNKILLDCAQEKRLPEYYKKFGYKINSVKKHLDHHDVYMFKKM